VFFLNRETLLATSVHFSLFTGFWFGELYKNFFCIFWLFVIWEMLL
jgi:hypothetical protein